jgi:hypothetical protein
MGVSPIFNVEQWAKLKLLVDVAKRVWGSA